MSSVQIHHRDSDSNVMEKRTTSVMSRIQGIFYRVATSDLYFLKGWVGGGEEVNPPPYSSEPRSHQQAPPLLSGRMQTRAKSVADEHNKNKRKSFSSAV